MDPSTTAAYDQLLSHLQDMGKLVGPLIDSLVEGGLSRRQAKRIAERWITNFLTSAYSRKG